MVYVYFGAAWGIPFAMMCYAWFVDPKRKKSTSNTGMRL